jgi:Heparinase II/III-like protein
MTASQRSTFMARYNGYTQTMMNKSWGGPGLEGNNYYWGILRNELNWGIATYYENPMAQTFLNDALVTRWQNGVLPYFAGPDKGGVTPEGAAYGPVMFSYPVVPFTTAGLMGRDLLSETNWYKEALFDTIYSTSTGQISGPMGTGYTQFPFGDDDTSNGQPLAGGINGRTYNGDFMTMAADEWAGLPVGEYARQWLNEVQPNVSDYVAATDGGGQAHAFSGLPLDYYASGTGYLYTKNSWASDATQVFLQMGQGSNASHMHLDSGSFQIYRGDKQLAIEHTGYAETFADGTDSASTAAHNGILYNGQGLASAWQVGPPVVLAVQSTPTYSYAAVDLSDAYHATSHDPAADNPYAGHTIREFLFIKPLETLFVMDRLESNSGQSSPASIVKSFLLHTPQSPVLNDANHATVTNGDEMLRLTTINSTETPTHSYSVVNEGGGVYRLRTTPRARSTASSCMPSSPARLAGRP